MLRKELLWGPGREDYLDGTRISGNLSEFENKSTHQKSSLITGDMKTMGCLPGHRRFSENTLLSTHWNHTYLQQILNMCVC